jgi:hypothetical protein
MLGVVKQQDRHEGSDGAKGSVLHVGTGQPADGGFGDRQTGEIEQVCQAFRE